MPTDENLRTRGCIIVSACCFCLNIDESSYHLFLQCPFAKELWTWLGGKLNCVIECASALSLLSCIPTRCSSQIVDLFLAAVIHTIHTIRLSRNSIRFSSNAANIQSAKVKIHSLVVMLSKASVGKYLHTDSTLLDSFTMPAHYRTCGGLFQDSRGSFLGAFVGNIGAASVFHSEVLAFILAMEHAAHHGWRNVWLESDSSSAILIFSNPSLVPLLLRNRWYNACSLGIQIIASHIFREGNCCADR